MDRPCRRRLQQLLKDPRSVHLVIACVSLQVLNGRFPQARRAPSARLLFTAGPEEAGLLRRARGLTAGPEEPGRSLAARRTKLTEHTCPAGEGSAARAPSAGSGGTAACSALSSPEASAPFPCSAESITFWRFKLKWRQLSPDFSTNSLGIINCKPYGIKENVGTKFAS